jgi:membrane protease YdiL (CAAX protease family)
LASIIRAHEQSLFPLVILGGVTRFGWAIGRGSRWNSRCRRLVELRLARVERGSDRVDRRSGVCLFHCGRRRFRDLGFAQVSWSSIAIGFVLAGFFIGIFGPLASWSLARLGTAGFEQGLRRVADLPTWYLILTIMVVASAEELLYRAYAIERLGTLIGSRWIAGFISLVMFCLAHVPMWGGAPALTTIAAGCIFTIVYLVRADVVALVIAHVATDLFGLAIAPHLAK